VNEALILAIATLETSERTREGACTAHDRLESVAGHGTK
jgi:hypothetical protein